MRILHQPSRDHAHALIVGFVVLFAVGLTVLQGLLSDHYGVAVRRWWHKLWHDGDDGDRRAADGYLIRQCPETRNAAATPPECVLRIGTLVDYCAIRLLMS
jgi:hypothetical protein